jgi:hypothetical protein
MKIIKYPILLLFTLFSITTFGQVSDAEKRLKTVNADTVMGWKKGGVFVLNLAQTSLSNWAAGGQNSVAVNGIFSAFIAPLTTKFTFVTDKALSDAGAFGVAPGEKSRGEIGGYIRAIYTRNDFKDEFLKNVAFTTKLDLFSNYIKNPQNIDITWEI